MVDTEDVEKVDFVVTDCLLPSSIILEELNKTSLSWFCFFKVLKDGWAVGAAVLGVPAKATIKEVPNSQFIMQKMLKLMAVIIWFHFSMQVNSDSLVVKTLDRKTLWEMQTPQVLIPFSMLYLR